jgi:hypothetical protein
MVSSLRRATLAAVVVSGLLVILNPWLKAQERTPHGSAESRRRLFRGVDTALSILGMRMADLSMPENLQDRDRHRNAFHDRLFRDPLANVTFTDSLAAALTSRTDSSMRKLYVPLCEVAGYRGAPPRVFKATPRNYPASFERRLRQAGPATRGLLDRYLEGTVNMAIAAQVARAMHRRLHPEVDLQWFRSHLDSMWTPSEEDEKLSLWQIYNNEVASRKTTALISKTINTQVFPVLCDSGMFYYLEFVRQTKQAAINFAGLGDSITSVIIDSDYGRIAIGGPGNDVYTGAYLLIIDVGGNDTYDLAHESDTVNTQVIIDFDGDDTYRGGDHSLGAGHFGIGMLIDRAGNDQYTARDFSIGSGTYGFGVLHDMAGNDIYRGRSNSQGAGIAGMGLLLDDAGHDVYLCASQSQAFGATHGVGILSDNGGNDRYIAVSPFADVLRYDDHQVSFAQGAALGSRPSMSGGLGLLVDASGNDLYSCDIYGQGTAYWYGLGALVDLGGDDRYDAYQYAQGSGVHFAVGILTDATGEDVYRSHGVSQGCGHDIATGLLRDHAGNDTYVCESLSLGAGNANAVSILYDESGQDSYSALNQGNTIGYSDMRRGYGMVGLFIDAGGRDSYGEVLRNDTAIVKSTYGLLLDADLEPTHQSSQQTVASVASYTLTSTVDSLFVQASASHLRFQNAVAPARKELGRRGQPALAFLETQLSTQMPRERLTLENVLADLYASDRDSTIALLRRGLLSSDNGSVSIAATVAGKVKCRELVPVLTDMLSDQAWRRRRLAVATLGEIGDSVSIPILRKACGDVQPYVRQRAANAYVRYAGADDSLLVSLLSDTLQIVRMAAIEGLLRGAKRPLATILPLIDRHTDHRSLPSVVRLLASSDTTASDIDTFSRWWSRQDDSRKGLVQRISSMLPRPLHDVVYARKPRQTIESGR